MSFAMGLGSRVARILLRPVHVTRIAILRIVVGFLMVIWSAALVFDADPLLTWLRVGPQGDVGWWQFWPSAPAPVVQGLALALVPASFLSMVGLWTRWATLTTFLLTLALQRYNPAAFNGGDFIMRCVLLLGLALAPSGRYLSIDARRAGRAIRWRSPLMAPWPLRFVQAHVSLGYLLTVLLKLRGHSWLGGTAIWYASGLGDLARFSLPDWITAPPVGAVLSWSTLAIELGVGVGVWFRRTRPWVLAAGLALHLGIALLFEIGLFSAVMIASYVVFLPDAADIRQLLPARWRRGAARVTPAEVAEPRLLG